MENDFAQIGLEHPAIKQASKGNVLRIEGSNAFLPVSLSNTCPDDTPNEAFLDADVASGLAEEGWSLKARYDHGKRLIIVSTPPAKGCSGKGKNGKECKNGQTTVTLHRLVRGLHRLNPSIAKLFVVRHKDGNPFNLTTANLFM
jgi:hypothetical protein